MALFSWKSGRYKSAFDFTYNDIVTGTISIGSYKIPSYSCNYIMKYVFLSNLVKIAQALNCYIGTKQLFCYIKAWKIQ